MKTTCVRDLMEKAVIKVGPEESLYDASVKMKEADCGCLPVGTGETVEGIITDRDIIIRAIAEGRNPSTEMVRDYMSNPVETCNEDDTVGDAAKKMRDCGVSRLIVTDDDDKPCGILTFGRILRNDNDVTEILEVIAFATGKEHLTDPDRSLQ